MRSLLAALVVGCLAGVTGCSGSRVVISLLPASDAMTETVVIDDRPAAMDDFRRRPKVAMIDVTGMIANARSRGALGSGDNPVAGFSESLHRAQHDDEVVALLIHVNSRGGTVTASELMYRDLLRFKTETGKPVVVLMSDYAASGGYYIACAGDEIIAHPTTITGSIGVIMQTMDVSGGLDMIGVRTEAITSGPNKDMASPLSPMSPEHRVLLQGIIDEFYDGFVEVVTTNREGIDESDLGWVTDGRVVTGRKANEIGLVDQLGDLHDAYAAAKRRAGLERARLVKYHRPTRPTRSPYAEAPTINVVNLELPEREIGFYYLWDPAHW